MKEDGRKGGQSHTGGSGSFRTVVHLGRRPQIEVIGQATGRDNTVTSEAGLRSAHAD